MKANTPYILSQTTMNLTSLLNQDRFRTNPSAESQAKTAAGIAEFLLLEECVASCEDLAELISRNTSSHPLMSELSECISACDSYLAAKSRKSHHEVRLGSYCAEVLVSTAAACRELGHEASVRCDKTCRVCLKILRRGHKVPAPLYS
jgi:hypothetical protein